MQNRVNLKRNPSNNFAPAPMETITAITEISHRKKHLRENFENSNIGPRLESKESTNLPTSLVNNTNHTWWRISSSEFERLL